MVMDWFPFWLSLRVAALATVAGLIAGLWLAYVLANRDFRGKELLDAAITLPLVLPPTVLGYYLLVLAGRASPVGKLYEAVFGGPLVFTWQAAVVAALVHSAPLLVKAVRGAFENVDAAYGKAARALGASEWRIFWRIALPLAKRSILGAAVLAFARALGDFGITIILAGNIPGRTQTAAVAIYSAVEGGNFTAAGLLSVAVSALALAALYLANRLSPKLVAG